MSTRIESEFSSMSGSAATVSAETADQAGVLHGTSSWFFEFTDRHRSRIHGSSHFPHARARAVAAAALPAGVASRSATPVVATPARFPRSFAAVVADPASACATSVHDGAFYSGVLVVCCLCANPPVTTWRCVARVPRAGRGSKVGFSVRPKICALSQIWRQG